MNKYKNGKIYKLTNGGLTYYGSTILTKEERLGIHMKPTNNTSSKALFQLGGIVEMDILEHFPCNSKFELEERERVYIESNWDNCVNINIPTRTRGEHYYDNIEKIKQYYLDNRDKMLLVDKKYRVDNRDKIAFRKKEYHKINKDKIALHKREYYKINGSNRARRWKTTEFGKLCLMYLI